MCNALQYAGDVYEKVRFSKRVEILLFARVRFSPRNNLRFNSSSCRNWNSGKGCNYFESAKGFRETFVAWYSTKGFLIDSGLSRPLRDWEKVFIMAIWEFWNTSFSHILIRHSLVIMHLPIIKTRLWGYNFFFFFILSWECERCLGGGGRKKKEVYVVIRLAVKFNGAFTIFWIFLSYMRIFLLVFTLLREMFGDR